MHDRGSHGCSGVTAAVGDWNAELEEDEEPVVVVEVVADGTAESERRIERVLTTDPGMGVVRHADAGYEEARRFARERGIRRPMEEK